MSPDLARSNGWLPPLFYPVTLPVWLRLCQTPPLISFRSRSAVVFPCFLLHFFFLVDRDLKVLSIISLPHIFASDAGCRDVADASALQAADNVDPPRGVPPR